MPADSTTGSTFLNDLAAWADHAAVGLAALVLVGIFAGLLYSVGSAIAAEVRERKCFREPPQK